ncbi:MAG TPA: site-2 protease family protein [Conexibacter sp.]|nr:site-2 protease family protein [Conexibacter sp.]
MDQRVEWLPPAAPAQPTSAAPPSVAPEDVGLPPAPPRTGIKRLAGPLAVIGAALAKLKGVLLLLPKLKLLTTSGTMLVSVAAYSLLWGWTFAAGFVLLLLVHELGHVIQLRREGIKASAPMFVPFMGAVVMARSLGENAAAEARVGLAGPVLGSLGAALLIPIWLATGNVFWQALAFTGFFLNLFNLLPVVPLDGGRAMAAMAPWMWFGGLVVMGALAIVFPNPIILVIFALAAFSTYGRWRARRAGGTEAESYYRVPRAQRLAIAAVYLGLIAALVVGMDATHLARTFANV